jgi:hypothetical protein
LEGSSPTWSLDSARSQATAEALGSTKTDRVTPAKPKALEGRAAVFNERFGWFVEYRCNRCLRLFWGQPLTDTITCPRCDSTNVRAL